MCGDAKNKSDVAGRWENAGFGAGAALTCVQFMSAFSEKSRHPPAPAQRHLSYYVDLVGHFPRVLLLILYTHPLFEPPHRRHTPIPSKPNMSSELASNDLVGSQLSDLQALF